MSASSSFIYHERQVASLCGQHCLNNLLQGPFFTSFNLADIANELDNKERELRAGENTMFESVNVDDSGNFSLTVLAEALRRSHALELKRVTFDSGVLKNPQNANGFVLNLASHWFSIRPLKRSEVDEPIWFNLNSINTKPEKIGMFYLSAFLSQMQASGYSIFEVVGKLPAQPRDTSMGKLEYWYTFESALAPKASKKSSMSVDDQMLQAALEASMQNNVASSSGNTLGGDHLKQQSPEDIRAARLKRFGNTGGGGQAAPPMLSDDTDGMSEEDRLNLAIAVSMSKS
eukprot:g7798.t1